MNTKIINNLKKEVCDIRSDYGKKEINLWYSVKNSLLNQKNKENQFYYQDEEEKIAELIKKEPMEIFEILAHHHLEKNKGFGEIPKQFQTPCYICNQSSLTTVGWSEEGYPNNLERFFCRLCRTSFGWIDIKDDPLELQEEMTKHYLVFTEKDIEKAKTRLDKVNEELVDVHEYLSDKQMLLGRLRDRLSKLII
jgi:hypothetical protein